MGDGAGPFWHGTRALVASTPSAAARPDPERTRQPCRSSDRGFCNLGSDSRSGTRWASRSVLPLEAGGNLQVLRHSSSVCGSTGCVCVNPSRSTHTQTSTHPQSRPLHPPRGVKAPCQSAVTDIHTYLNVEHFLHAADAHRTRYILLIRSTRLDGLDKRVP